MESPVAHRHRNPEQPAPVRKEVHRQAHSEQMRAPPEAPRGTIYYISFGGQQTAKRFQMEANDYYFTQSQQSKATHWARQQTH